MSGPRTAAGPHAGVDADLARHAPHLRDGFRDALPDAAATVGRRLLGALLREGLTDVSVRGRRHGFGRVEVDRSPAGDPGDLVPAGAAGLAAEIRNAVANLAVAVARRALRPAPPAGPAADADERALAAERLAVAGHNLHPCGRTRLGWSTADVLAHDLEADRTTVGFVAVRADLPVGDDLSAMPGCPPAPPGYRVLPVHAWQRDTVLPHRYADLLADGTLRILPDEVTAAPTAALRTLLLPAGPGGARRYLKVSLDVQVTSTRRGISVASTRNGPLLGPLLRRVFDADPDGHRLLLLDEPAGAAVPVGTGRDLSAIVRTGLAGRLAADEWPVPGGALPAIDPATGGPLLADLVSRYAHTRRRRDDAAAALAFLDEYARLLLPPLLRLATGHGIALEAHLQNSVPTFVAGVPHRLALRDFAGMRLHPGRLHAAGHPETLWPGSVIATADQPVLLAKLGYTALQAHLGELVVQLTGSHGLDEPAAWRAVRAVVDATYAPLRAARATAAAAAADHAALTAAFVAHKALVTMRIRGGGDRYVPVPNPLHAAGPARG